MIEKCSVKKNDLDSSNPNIEVEVVEGEANEIDDLAKFLAFMYFKLKEEKQE